MLRLLSGILFLLVAPIGALAGAATAQTTDATVYIRTTTLDGFAMTDACYTIVNASIEGCDDNGDGQVDFEDVPVGDYTVRQTQGVAGYLPVGEFPITVETYSPEQYFDVLMAPTSAQSGTTVDIAVSAVDPLNGEPTPGNCMILHGGSIEGCDENGDGRITFQDVAVGTYLLEETVTPDGAYPFGRQWIAVRADGPITVLRPMTGAIPDAGTADVALVTRDPDTGDLIPGACYVIENASVEGCDENGDAQVDFDDVQVGVFTVQQTQAPAGYQPTNDFDINIAPLDPEQSIVVKQAPNQHDADHRHVSVVLYDTNTGQRIPGTTCLEIFGASLEGCDDNRDGQIDFLDVPVGNYPIAFTEVPAGYVPAFVTNTLSNDPDNPFSVTVVYIGLTPGG
jgi:large repetitive protein